MASSVIPLLILGFFCTATVNQVVSAGFVLEDGYTVSTIIDGNKRRIHPYLILPQFGSSDFVILDHSSSTFYTLSFPSGVITKLAGNGMAEYADGELGSATFNKPENFAVDYKGNIYVAEKRNHTIRKISKSGVTTIAGGYSHSAGKKDGHAQNATFSDDFELTFIPERCALMISDRGNSLIRQINLKAEDCRHGSHSGLGMSSAWAVGLGLSGLLLGLVVGFVSRPYVMSRGGVRLLPCKGTWKYCLMSLVRQVLMLCFDIRSAVVSLTLSLYMLLKRLIQLSLSHLSLMFRINTLEFQPSYKKPSLLDFNNSRSSNVVKLEQLKDLISFDEGVESLGTNLNLGSKDGRIESTDISVVSSCSSKIDKMVQTNIMGFSEQALRTSLGESQKCDAGLVKRK